MNKLLREHQFAKVDLGKRHPWTRLLRVELIRRRHPERK
jgi:hypothetical protein